MASGMHRGIVPSNNCQISSLQESFDASVKKSKGNYPELPILSVVKWPLSIGIIETYFPIHISRD